MAKRGFTLIEVIISLAILAIGLVGILSLFPIGFDSARRSVNATQVAIYAHEKLEQVRNAGYPATGSTSGNFTDPSYTWTQVISTADVGAGSGLRKVKLTVNWSYGGRSYSQAFTTYVANK